MLRAPTVASAASRSYVARRPSATCSAATRVSPLPASRPHLLLRLPAAPAPLRIHSRGPSATSSRPRLRIVPSCAPSQYLRRCLRNFPRARACPLAPFPAVPARLLCTRTWSSLERTPALGRPSPRCCSSRRPRPVAPPQSSLERAPALGRPSPCCSSSLRLSPVAPVRLPRPPTRVAAAAAAEGKRWRRPAGPEDDVGGDWGRQDGSGLGRGVWVWVWLFVSLQGLGRGVWVWVWGADWGESACSCAAQPSQGRRWRQRGGGG
jgi:hypothetical protein